MAPESLADIVRDETTRIGRALRLLDERSDEIVRVAPFTYLVPSCSGEGFYRVVYGGEVDERCSCPDHEFSGESCKHLLAVGVLRARRRRSSKVSA